MLALVLLLAAAPAFAQEGSGFAGLGTEVEGFALPDPAATLEFPRDHGAHPSFRIEWWYLTANLTGADGQDYGVQWTLFRSALAPEGPGKGWATPQVWMAHAAVTTAGSQHVAERFARGGVGQAGVEAAPFAAWIDEWRMAAAEGGTGIDRLEVSARGEGFAYRLEAEAQGPLVLHGAGGYSVKGQGGQASHYYSQPFYTVTGTLSLPAGEVAVTGTAWLDREWSSQPLDRSQTGWDWLALSFDDGRRLMAAEVRGLRPFVFGSLIGADGSVASLDGSDLGIEAGPGRVPARFRVTVPGAGIDVTAEAVNPEAWMTTSVPYWEGPLRVRGSATGRGYLEMTGRPRPGG
ncbi:iron ABC transporter permease [Paracoccus sp. S-4012]|uniref:lipocalin-like domain-containing protein n=1 Tax=Paracoccus sp. S-4012 TaxID=2665648 RepID=UPI0012B06154|nr:lipocalin-like domain-containing protein [Paracoccus sp. S-4012]MRX50366.1 iron ABC transporter permease [Paracoccus sp. S-4012]